ncbi:MAG: HD domain-containing protein [Sedimentisphaerales bacterium]|nr:HD domain-containing protein [Sedimentisphaerales bacterium]
MTPQQLEQFKKWFYDYVADFYNDDEINNDNIRLKEDHTRRMCEDTLLIAGQLGLSEEQKIIAETISLFHDVGRFEQFRKYRSYNDVHTENHSLLALKVLAEHKILDDLDPDERQIIETSVRLHGDKELPENLDGQTELFAKLVRDIDKLDIYCVTISIFDDLRDNPEKYLPTFGFPASEGYSKEIIQAVLENRTIAYKELKTINDMIIAMSGWIIDVNFIPTLKEMKKRKLLDQMTGLLPDTKDIREVIRHIKNQLDERIKAS